MKTDDLITALAADLPTRPTPVLRAVAYAIAASLPLITVLLMVVAPRDRAWSACCLSRR